MNEYMKMADKLAKQNIITNDGGPFGAVIVKDGKVVGSGNNHVIANNDPTAHAEIMAIRNACQTLNTFDLSGCELYTSCYPCPMCLSAIIWANIKEVYYACTKDDAGKIGFRDDMIYEYLKGNNRDLINLKQIDRDGCINLFEEYKKNNKIIY